MRNQSKHDLEIIQDKVAIAMDKKKEIINQLQEEIHLKDLQIVKLKDLMDK